MAKNEFTSASLDASEASCTSRLYKDPHAMPCMHGFGYYGITIKHTGTENYHSQSQLDDIWAKIVKQNPRYKFTDHIKTYELDSKNRLHMHLYVEGKPRAWIRPIPNYHINLAPLANQYDCIKWQSYICKDARDDYLQEAILLKNEAMNKNMFELI